MYVLIHKAYEIVYSRCTFSILFACVIVVGLTSCGQTENDHIRIGNKLYADSVLDKAQVEFQKALEINPKSAIAHYNMGNALKEQNILDKAYESYGHAIANELNESRLADSYHNMGVVKQDSQKFEEAIDNYKKSLRINPHDDESRYNLVLCQHQLQKQQQNQQNQNDNNQQDKDEENKNQQKQDQQKQDNEKQNNEQQQQKQDPNQMSKENAEQLLNAVMQKEKDTQEQVKKAQQLNASRRQLEKQW